MAPKKRRSSKISKQTTVGKKKTSTTTSKKLSMAAKRRRRVAGKFATGRVYAASDKKPKDAEKYFYKESPSNKKLKGISAGQSDPSSTVYASKKPVSEAKASAQQYYQKELRKFEKLMKGQPRNLIEREARKSANKQFMVDTGGVTPRSAGMSEKFIQGQEGMVETRVGSARVAERTRQMKSDKWQGQDSLYKDTASTKKLTNDQFIKSQMPDTHQSWLKEARTTGIFAQGLPPAEAGSLRGGVQPGARRRSDKYIRELRGGASHEVALQRAMSDKRGRPAGTSRALTKEMVGLGDEQTKTRRNRADSVIEQSSKLGMEIDVPAVDSINALAQKFPNASEGKLVEIQQNQAEYIASEVAKNQRWSHERKRAQAMGSMTGNNEPDRITVFTTTLGKPDVSVPTDSIVGQYIIGKRRKVAAAKGLAPQSFLKGRFPEALRDLHIIDASTNTTVGAQGAVGLFRRSGWRAGTKASKNYGRPIPFGSQVLYNEQGQPMYDKQGNVVFSDGATRKYRLDPTRGLGFGVFIG